MPMPIEVRTATPEDGPAVCRVHVSTVERWELPDALGQRTEAPWETLSLEQRYRNAGPWADPDACTVHIARMVEAGQWPIVALDEAGEVAGEIEVIAGPDALWGPTAHIDVLAVDRDRQRRGFGRALVEEARRRAVASGHRMLTTTPEEDAVGFDRKCGLTEVLARQRTLVFPSWIGGTGPSGALQEPVGTPYGPLEPLELVLGRYQTSFAAWIKTQWLIPGLSRRWVWEEGRFEELGAFYRVRPHPNHRRRASVLAWAERARGTEPLVYAAARRARELGFDALETTVDVADITRLMPLACEAGEETIILGGRLGP
jgi:GNAT superfamily N-acetyltransferase